VSFIQAYIFTMLSSLYIGFAVEDHSHLEHEEVRGEPLRQQLPLP
jgi:hypothetical protein